MRSTEDAAPAGATRDRTAESRGRRIAFRTWSVITSLWFLLLYGIGALELILMWLPDQTLISTFEDETLPIHRTHFLIVGIVSWAFLLATLVQLRRPERRIAPMIQLMVMTVGAAVVFAFSGTVGEWLFEEGLVLLPVAVLALLHPGARELIRRPSFDGGMTALASLSAIPWMVYAVNNGRLQLLNTAGDAHGEMEHWAMAALLGITVLACAFIGSTDHKGWRLPAWIAAAAPVILGMHSQIFPSRASALSAVWAILAIVWGLVFAGAIVRRTRLDPPTAGQLPQL